MTNESDIYTRLRTRIGAVTNEAEVRQAWTAALAEATGIQINTERLRIDLSFNNVIIEFKDKGLFNGRSRSPLHHVADTSL